MPQPNKWLTVFEAIVTRPSGRVFLLSNTFKIVATDLRGA